MRILSTLTYYTPHISGLTVYARRVLQRLAGRGHEVTVLTSRYSSALPAREVIDGVTVVRSPVLLSVSKGALMPGFMLDAARLIPKHDLVYLHLPQFEAGGVALLAKQCAGPSSLPTSVTSNCLPGLPRVLFTSIMRLSHYIAGKCSDRIVVTSPAYGERARLPRHFHQKVLSVHPPIELAAPSVDGSAFRRQHNLGEGPLVGFVGRFAEEKGISYLVDSVPLVLREIPDARFVLAGPTATVLGERVHEQLGPRIAAFGSTIVHLGLIADDELAAFYHAIDVLVLPSTNSTESFGMTQAEAMLAGTPVVASDMPGVREAVRLTGMGLLVPPSNAQALARAIVAVLGEPQRYLRPSDEIQRLFDPESTATFYEQLFSELTGRPAAAPHLQAEGAEAAPKEPGAERKR